MKLAVWQAKPVSGDTEANLFALDRAAEEAAARGADVLLGPEMFLSGYDLDDYRASALADPFGKVAEICRRHRIAVVIGGPDLIDDTTVMNAAVCVDRDGQERTRYHKQQLFGDLDRNHFAAGDAVPEVIDIAGSRIAILICYDVEFPERVREAAEAGATVVLVPTGLMAPFRFVPDHMIATRAYENHVHIAYANQHGDDRFNSFVGLSTAADPLGGTLATAPDSGEALLLVDIDESLRAEATRFNSYFVDLVRRDSAARG